MDNKYYLPNYISYQYHNTCTSCFSVHFLHSVPQKPGTEINVISIEPGMDDTALQDDLEYLADLAVPSEVLGFVSILYPMCKQICSSYCTLYQFCNIDLPVQKSAIAEFFSKFRHVCLIVTLGF